MKIYINPLAAMTLIGDFGMLHTPLYIKNISGMPHSLVSFYIYIGQYCVQQKVGILCFVSLQQVNKFKIRLLR